MTRALIGHAFLTSLVVATALSVATAPAAFAQSAVAFVNDEPISALDVAERQRWMVLTRGFGDRMKAAVASDAVKNKFREMMIAANPRSQEEAIAARDRIQKVILEDVKRRVMAEAGSSMRKAAIDALIEERLKTQAAKRLGINISAAEIEEVIASNSGKTDAAGKAQHLAEFYAKFQAEGISKQTIQNIYRAQLSWRDVIRRQYGPRIQAALSAAPAAKAADGEQLYDVRIVRLPVANTKDEKAVGKRMLEAQNLQERVSSCADLQKQTKLLTDMSIKSVDKAKISSFPKDVQPLLLRANEGQMTPPRVVGSAVESYALCRKVVAAKPGPKQDDKPDVRQQEFERYSRSYLQELRRAASIDMRGS